MIEPRKLLFSVIFALAAVGVSPAVTYYVTQSGAGSQTGSSLANAWSVTNYNASSLPTGGDTVSFSGTITTQVSPHTSGTGNGASRLTLDFTSATLSGTLPRISIASKNFLTLNGGTFATASSGALIATNGQIHHDNTINGWTFVGPAGGIATICNCFFAQNLTVSNNHFDNVSGLGYSDSSATHDILITGNYIRTSINTATQTDVVTFGDAANVTIEKNILIQRAQGDNASGQHNDVIQTFHSGSGGAADPSGWIIRYNWIGLEMETSVRTGDNSWMMMENLANGTAGFACKIYANVFHSGQNFWSGNNGMGCGVSNTSAKVYVYNNTIIRKNGPDHDVGGWNNGVLYMRNNIGMAAAGETGTFYNVESTMTAGAQWNLNFWYQFGGCDATLSGSNGSCITNPQFVDFTNDSFALQSTSPLINAGDSTIGAEYNQGIAPGATWPNPTLVTRAAGSWDVGAYQSGGTGAALRAPSGLTALVQ